MMESKIGKTVGGAVLCLSALGVGCGPTTNVALERAQVNYQQAQQNPEITAHAPGALQEAQQSLQRAERAWKNEKDDDEVAHLAYVTDQRVKIARETAEKNIAEAEIKQLSAERKQIMLEARTREATRAQREAEKARTHADLEAARAQRLEQELQPFTLSS